MLRIRRFLRKAFTPITIMIVPQFKVHVVRDAISSRKDDNRDTAVERMRANGVTITSTEMVIYELLKRAGTDEFKATLPLVK